MNSSHEVTVFGAGCFWGVEAAFRKLNGVVETYVGYAGGAAPEPSYEEVCGGNTGHAEVVHVSYDSKLVSYAELLKCFFAIHDPTQLNRQGPDVGTQYRSVIFYSTEQQCELAKAVLEEVPGAVTQVLPAPHVYRAEEYHQRYFEKNPQAMCQL